MKMKLLGGAALAAVFAATSAGADQPDGFYAAVDGGYHMELNGGIHTHTTANAPDGAPYGWKWSYDGNWAAFARVGYQFSPHWRVELEGGYRKGDVHSVIGSLNRAQPVGLCSAGVVRIGDTAADAKCNGPGGSLDDITGFGNVIYDIFPNSKIDPFIGGGVGISYLQVKTFGQLAGVPAADPTPYQNLSVNHDDTAFAYQGIAGVAYHVTDRLSLDLTYRWMRTADHRWTSTGSGDIQPGTFRGRYEDQTLTAGLRWNFGPEPVAAAPPPPPPPPPPAEAPPPPPPAPPPAAPATPDARQFVVYFPFDQSVLTTDAQSVVQAAATYAMQGQPTHITVVGHTDTSGSFKYNLRLSERRAKTVADALVGLGVNQGVLTVDWKGKTDLAVATPDGVKEPLNRRSTIDINFQ